MYCSCFIPYQAHPESAVAVNLKACNHFRLYNGRAAEAELKVLADQGLDANANDLIRHNQVWEIGEYFTK